MSPPGRLGVALVLVAGIATLSVDSLRRALLVALLVSAVIALARPRFGWLVRRGFAAALAIFTVLVPILLGSDAARALALGYRALAAALVALAISSTLSLSELPSALRALGVPKILASTIFALSWQLGHVVDEARRLLLARRLRGASGIGPGVMSSLLIRTRLRADRIELAMQLRGVTSTNAALASGFAQVDGLALAAALAITVLLHWVR